MTSPTVDLPKRLPLVIEPENRSDSTAKDARLVNCYVEKQRSGEVHVFKRAGTARSSQPTGGAAAGRGMWNWLGDIYSVFGTKLYKNGVDVSGAVVLNGTTDSYKWSSTLGATPRLQLGNGTSGYNYDSGAGLVLITDAQFPSSFVKGWAYLDGTTYVMTPAAAIQGSDINDPINWDALNVLTAQIEPDRGVALSKQLVYVIALKQWTSEVFYDAQNASGSPLGTVQGAKINYGCASADSVASVDDIMFWVSTNRTGDPQVVKLDGLKAGVISTDPIERLLASISFTTVYAFTIKSAGHRFYVFTSVVSNLTLVYDLDQDTWHQWTDANGNYFPFVAAVCDSNLNTFLQHETDGYIYTLSENTYTDNAGIITVDIYTPGFDGGTRRGKQLGAMYFNADQTPGSVLQVRSNDNDYGTKDWSTFRYIDLSQERPALFDEGTFTRRAYNFRHQKATAFRMSSIDLQMDLCTL